MLDADGTLFDYDAAEAGALRQALERYGFPYNEETRLKYRRINMNLWADFENGRVGKDSLQTVRFEQLFQAIGVSADPGAFNEIFLDCLVEGSFLIEGAFAVCRELSKYCTLAIATNGVARTQKKRLENSAISPYIGHMLVSEEAGYQKPQRGFFDYAFQICGHYDRESAIIVGDSFRADIKGGADYGIATCWFNPRRQKPEDDYLRADYEIRQLAELTGIIML